MLDGWIRVCPLTQCGALPPQNDQRVLGHRSQRRPIVDDIPGVDAPLPMLSYTDTTPITLHTHHEVIEIGVCYMFIIMNQKIVVLLTNHSSSTRSPPSPGLSTPPSAEPLPLESPHCAPPAI
jgi:hypothetical protein